MNDFQHSQEFQSSLVCIFETCLRIQEHTLTCSIKLPSALLTYLSLDRNKLKAGYLVSGGIFLRVSWMKLGAGSGCWFIPYASTVLQQIDAVASADVINVNKQICLTSHNLSLMMPFQRRCIRTVNILRSVGNCLQLWRQKAQSHQICQMLPLSTQEVCVSSQFQLTYHQLTI